MDIKQPLCLGGKNKKVKITAVHFKDCHNMYLLKHNETITDAPLSLYLPESFFKSFTECDLELKGPER